MTRRKVPQTRCRWCGGKQIKDPKWEQQPLMSDIYVPMCNRCANRRLKNPYNALLGMRKIGGA